MNTVKPSVESDVLLDQLSALKKATVVLRNQGLVPIASHAHADSHAVIQVAVHRLCHLAVADGGASYGRQTERDLHGRFHDLLNGVEVVWTERVQP